MKVLCILVLYKTKLVDSVAYNSFIKYALPQNEFSLFVYDNSPETVQIESSEKIKYVSDTSNPGVSKAYNQGALYAKNNGFEWIILLDQDTSFRNHSYLECCSKMFEDPDINLIAPLVYTAEGVFSPLYCSHHCPRCYNYKTNEMNDIDRAAIVNSGMVIRVSAFFEVGGYNEEVPLDLSDYQFIERYKKKYKTFFLIDFILDQSFSNNVDSYESLLRRFGFYVKGVKNFECSFPVKVDFYLLMLKRCLSLVISTKSFSFFYCLFRQ